MTLPILERERDELVTRMKTTHEELQANHDDGKQKEFDELRAKIESVNKKISDQQFVDAQSVRSAPKKEKADEQLSVRVAREYDLRKAIDNAKHGRSEGLEGEVQQELRALPANKKHDSNAVLIPDELHQRAVTTSGDISTDSFRPQEFLPVLRNRSVASALGARMIAGVGEKVRIPRQGTATEAEWQSETGAATATDMGFLAPISLEPHRLTYYTSHSDQVVREAGGGLPIQRLIIEEGQKAMADKLDASIFSLRGLLQTGRLTAEANAPTQLWKVGASTFGSIAPRARTGDSSGKALTYDDILELAGSSADANLQMMRPGFAINFKTQRKLKQTRKIDGATDSVTVFENGMIDGYPTQISNRISSDYNKTSSVKTSVMFYSSDWQYLVICVWGNTALVVDPYSSAPSSQVRLVWHQFLDYKILRNEAFAWYDSILLT